MRFCELVDCYQFGIKIEVGLGICAGHRTMSGGISVNDLVEVAAGHSCPAYYFLEFVLHSFTFKLNFDQTNNFLNTSLHAPSS